MGRLVTRHNKKRSMLGIAALMALVLMAGLPTMPVALAAVDHDIILRERLDTVRELLDRRQAHRRMLTGKIERFSEKLNQLQSKRESSLTALTSHEDRARSYERELDRLMPRLLPRLTRLDQLRKDGARTIAGLASLERSSKVQTRTRSRLLAAQPVSIEQMRRASTAVRLLRRVPNTLTGRHRDVDFQIPLLTASVSRLDLQQSQLQRRRDRAIRDLADLSVDIDRLTAEEHRLARNMMARSLEVTDDVDAQPNSLKAVLQNRGGTGKSAVSAADVRGIALRQAQPTPVARPFSGITAMVERAAITQRRPSLSAGGKVTAPVESWPSDEAPNPAARTASLSIGPAGDDLVGRVAPGRQDSGPVLTPTIETIGYSADREESGDRLEVRIAALPGQRVAAPKDGRVVFAGDFRSYGLLLIIEHGNGYHTLLWGFSSLDVAFGDVVQTDQILGILKGGPSPKLHVELRRNGQPVSPEVWLAASNSGVKG